VQEIYEEEILSAIWDSSLDKAPRLDDFTIHFYRECCWNIIIFDSIRMLKYVHKS
jgi:hypothetical protein